MHDSVRSNDFAACLRAVSTLTRVSRTARIVLSAREMGRIFHAKGVERLVRNELWKGRSPERFYDAMEWLYGWKRRERAWPPEISIHRTPWSPNMNYVFEPRTSSRCARRGQRCAVPSGAPHLLRWPQLRRARTRDGLRPGPRAAVFLLQARQQPSVVVPPGKTVDDGLPVAKQRLPARDRTGGRHRQGRPRHNRWSSANEHVFGYAVGLDMTRRDLQLRARDKGRPWELGKAFDASAPIAPIHPAASKIGHPTTGRGVGAGRWRRPPAQRHRQAHLVGARGHRQSVDLLRAAAPAT